MRPQTLQIIPGRNAKDQMPMRLRNSANIPPLRSLSLLYLQTPDGSQPITIETVTKPLPE
jgi:hypothetical protein